MTAPTFNLTGFIVVLAGLALISIPPNYPVSGVVLAALGSTIMIFTALTRAEAVRLPIAKRVMYAAALPVTVALLFATYVFASGHSL
ncbi:MAG: hypothetical protein RKE49_01775 [Oceanicaulis sp.]